MGPIPREMHRRVGLFLALLAAAFLTTPPAIGGVTTPTFTFYGSGYGHGLGLSQWGAYGMAQQGKTYRQILTHFYKGTTVGKASSAPWKLRIGVVQSKRVVHLTAVGGRVELRLLGAHVAWIPEGKTWTVAAASDGSYLVKDAAGAVVGGKTRGSARHGLVVVNGAGAVVKVGESGHSYKRGTIEFNTYRPCGGCGFRERLIAVLRPQLYLYGIGEVSSSWPTQSLETQAVAARTYAFEKVSRLGQHRPGCNCALYGTRGALIQAYYHASSGGFTENNENVWGGSPIPYLRGVCDPGDFTRANPVRTWTLTFTDAALTTKLATYTGSIGTVTGFSGAVRGVSGRIESITVVGAAEKATISGGALRAALGLRDTRVWIGSNRNVTGAIRGRYDALMCAPGAAAGSQKAVPGGRRQVFATGALYRNAANGRVIWLRGSVFSRYAQLGDASGSLGIPVSGTRTVTLPSGCRKYHCSITRFAGGSIYFKGATGVGIHELHGALYRYFRSLGGVRSRLGFPTSDVKIGAGGRTWAAFEGGTITCTGKGACWRS